MPDDGAHLPDNAIGVGDCGTALSEDDLRKEFLITDVPRDAVNALAILRHKLTTLEERQRQQERQVTSWRKVAAAVAAPRRRVVRRV